MFVITENQSAHDVVIDKLSDEELALIDAFGDEFVVKPRPKSERKSESLRPKSRTSSRRKSRAKKKHRARKPRKSASRDRRAQEVLRRLDPWAASTLEPPSVKAPTPRPYSLLNKRQRADHNDQRRLPAWNCAGDLLRMQAAARGARERSMRAFSLNLSPGIAHQALGSSRGPLTYIHDRIDKAIRQQFHFGLEFAFRPEFTDDGRLHIHGIIEVPPGFERRVNDALMAAGGTWDASHSEFQLDTRDLYDGDGWARYCDKTASRTRRLLGLAPAKSILSMTRGIRKDAESYWNRLRDLERDERARLKTARASRSGAHTSSVMVSWSNHAHLHRREGITRVFRYGRRQMEIGDGPVIRAISPANESCRRDRPMAPDTTVWAGAASK